MNRLLSLSLCLLLAVAMANAQSYPIPSGVFCSCGPTTGMGYGSVDPSIASKSFVKGILVRVGWNLLEPTDDQFNWVQLDTQMVRAKAYGKKVTLGVVNGPYAPQWLYGNGVQYAAVNSANNDTIPFPWDSTYLAEWDELVREVGNRYNGDTTLVLVHITHATANGFEFFLNPAGQFDWVAAGYTDSLIIDSWKKVMNSFNAAFPDHYLDNDYHPIFLSGNSSSLPADSIYAFAKQTIGSRYGAFSSWWTQNNVTAYPDQYNDLLESATNTFATVQVARNGTTDSAALGPGGLAGAISKAIDDGICYWEVWNQDILNPYFETMLMDAKCDTVPTAVLGIKNENLVASIYPNPLSSKAVLELNGVKQEGNFSFLLTNIQGQVVKYIDKLLEGETQLDFTGVGPGLYYYRLYNGTKNISIGKLIIE